MYDEKKYHGKYHGNMSMVFSIVFHGISMVFLWYFYGISMVFLWYFMVFLWYFMVFHEISMVFLWYFIAMELRYTIAMYFMGYHGISMGHCPPHGPETHTLLATAVRGWHVTLRRRTLLRCPRRDYAFFGVYPT